MNKNELISYIAEKTGYSKSQTQITIETFIETIKEFLVKGQIVRLPGFGSFVVYHRAASKGRNPSTGEKIDIPERNVPKFSPSKNLKESVNQ